MAETTEFGPRKTVFILAIVAGCFAVLWPKVFYPMFATTVTHHHSSDEASCCDVIFESDVNVVDILQEMCRNILKHHQIDSRVRNALSTDRLTPQGANLCRQEVLERCDIDLSTFLAEKERLGKSHKQVLEEIRSFNHSLCLKINFGVPFAQLGTPHLIRSFKPTTPIKQERSIPVHAGMHPALRERGRAIPSSHIVPKIKDRPDHVGGVPIKTRPTIGGAGHVVPPPKGGGGGMGIIMPLYTLGIVLFFLYTISKVLRKASDNEIHPVYVGESAEKEFQRMVFSPETFIAAFTGGPEKRPKTDDSHVPTLEELQEQAAGNIEIDQLRRRLVETEAAMERIVVQMNMQRNARSSSPQQETKDENTIPCCGSDVNQLKPSVKVLGMETTVASEDGGRCNSRPTSPVPRIQTPVKEKTPPNTIYLEGELPHNCDVLVEDSETLEEELIDDDEEEHAIVLSGKVTLSLIGHDQETNNNEAGSTKLNGATNLNDDEYKDSSEELTEEYVTKQRVTIQCSKNEDEESDNSCYEDQDNLWLDEDEEELMYSGDEMVEE